MMDLVAEHELDEVGERHLALLLRRDYEYDGAVEVLILRFAQLGHDIGAGPFEGVENALPVLRRLSIPAAEHVFAAKRAEQHRLLDDEGPSQVQRVIRPLVRAEIRL